MQICYVHGAGASHLSFNWLREQLSRHTATFFTYSIDEPAVSAAIRLGRLLDKPTILVGHSLGGIIAAACAELPHVTRLITLCSPFGGIRYVEFAAMFSSDPLFHDLRSHGQLLTAIRGTKISKPHLAIVGTNGLPFINEHNDGVVTVNSQMALDGPRYEMLPLNHFEVLLSADVVKLIDNFT